MDIPEDWEVAIASDGITYHKCDNGAKVFRSFVSIAGTAFPDGSEDTPLSDLRGRQGKGKVVYITHREFSEVMRMVFCLLKEGEK